MGRRIKKPKQKSTRAKLKEWSSSVRDRDNHTCQICGMTQAQLLATGKKSYLNAHHIVDKYSIGELKYDTRMGITLCPKCHKFGGIHSAHGNGCWFAKWLFEHKPEQYNFVINFSNESGRQEK